MHTLWRLRCAGGMAGDRGTTMVEQRASRPNTTVARRRRQPDGEVVGVIDLKRAMEYFNCAVRLKMAKAFALSRRHFGGSSPANGDRIAEVTNSRSAQPPCATAGGDLRRVAHRRCCFLHAPGAWRRPGLSSRIMEACRRRWIELKPFHRHYAPVCVSPAF